MIIREVRRWIAFKLRELRNSYYRFMGVKVGKNVFISSGAWIDTQDGCVTIGDNVRITKGCKVLSHDHTAWILNNGEGVVGETHIGPGVFLGMNVVVLPGVTIGEGSIIGAGCVVSKDIPSYSVLVSAKPRIIKRKNIETNEWEPC